MSMLTMLGGVEVDTASLLFNVDTYKVGMHKQYPEGTTQVYSYVSSRGGKHTETVMFGLQYFIKEFLSKPITHEQIDAAELYWEMSGSPLPVDKLHEMVDATGGYWPVRIQAVPEGTVVPVKNVVAVVYNTDPRFYWATTWIETAMLRAIWYGSTVATNSREIKKTILKYLDKTGTPEDIDFKLHDFGARGAASFESSAIGSAAHLVNFKGTDTMVGNLFLQKYYGTTIPYGCSIPASEHSTITSWGRWNEFDAYSNMVDQHNGIFACVSDSYNIYTACEMWNTLAPTLKKNATTLVVRPDSGDPLEVIPQCLNILSKGFGITVNEKGFAVLDGVRLIWGDGINHEMVEDILYQITDHGWSADNIAFGIGGALLQGVVRDDQKWAMKASLAVVNGVETPVFKDPITDQGKRSMAGRVTLYKDAEGKFYTGEVAYYKKSELNVVYDNGIIYDTGSFDLVRQRAAI